MLLPLLASTLLFHVVILVPLNRSEPIIKDHVEQMPIERDGELNDKFRQEMIFSHNLDTSDTKQLAESIKEMFEQWVIRLIR